MNPQHKHCIKITQVSLIIPHVSTVADSKQKFIL